jgi:hypothetical protein
MPRALDHGLDHLPQQVRRKLLKIHQPHLDLAILDNPFMGLQ